jgi:hypothetical protein
MTMIPISEAESTALLEKSGPLGQYVPLSFGPGGVALDTEDAGARWAIDTLQAMRAAERDLARDLNLAVETRLRDDLHEALAEEFGDEIRHERLDLVGQRVADELTTAVFEALRDAGFTMIRKA